MNTEDKIEQIIQVILAFHSSDQTLMLEGIESHSESACQEITLLNTQALSNRDLTTDSRRLFHGRGHCFAGLEHLVIDWFSPSILITIFKEESDEFLFALKDALLLLFLERYSQLSIDSIVLQDRSGRIASSTVLHGELAQSFAMENDLRFHIELDERQNVGFFLDMRIARQWLANNAKGKEVLNLFSFTCAFSVAAASAGARSVVNLDMGKGVLERGRLNHDLNSLENSRASFIRSDVFKSWSKLQKYGRYDIVIIDPPSFQKGSFNVEKDYLKVVRRLSKLLKPESKILACLNSPFLNEATLDDWFLGDDLPGCRKLGRINNPPEFMDENADKALKVVVYEYTRPESLPSLQVKQG